MIKWHELKSWPQYFNATLRGDKDFDLRLDDRAFGVCDYLILREWNPKNKQYTGRQLTRQIKYILRDAFDLPEGMVILGLKTV